MSHVEAFPEAELIPLRAGAGEPGLYLHCSDFTPREWSHLRREALSSMARGRGYVAEASLCRKGCRMRRVVRVDVRRVLPFGTSPGRCDLHLRCTQCELRRVVELDGPEVDPLRN